MGSVHIQIYNSDVRSSASFTYFSRLPKELRLYIWSLSLRSERFLRVNLLPPTEDSERPYRIDMKGDKILSKLMHVNAEARQVAEEFYPVKFPCRYQGAAMGHDGTFYFHPELDIIWLLSGGSCETAFVPFLSDLRENDPKGIGLQNLAAEHQDIRALETLETSQLAPDEHKTLISSMPNLKNMYYVSLNTAGRIHLGHFSGAPSIQDLKIHRARPVMAYASSFTRIQPDPRPDIDQDLSKLCVGAPDPRSMVFCWRKLLQKWGIPVPTVNQTEHHFLLAYGRNYFEPIRDRRSGERWLEEEHDVWVQCQEKLRSMKGLTVPIEKEEDLQQVRKTAMGFWLFPVTALGKFPKKDVGWDSPFWQANRVLDLTNFRPQLCLANLT